MNIKGGHVIHLTERSEDMYATIDQLSHKVRVRSILGHLLYFSYLTAYGNIYLTITLLNLPTLLLHLCIYDTLLYKVNPPSESVQAEVQRQDAYGGTTRGRIC